MASAYNHNTQEADCHEFKVSLKYKERDCPLTPQNKVKLKELSTLNFKEQIKDQQQQQNIGQNFQG